MSAAAPSWARWFSPQGQFNQVPTSQVQDQWGLPAEVRLDNGCPWGGWYDLPTVFALWLLGLGVQLHFNPACSPQDNGVIERANGTGQRWSEVQQCGSVAQLQARLNAADEIQRAYMPSIQGKSRLEAFATLRHSGRTYSRPWEQEHWSLDRAAEALETYVAKRQVGSQGSISLYYRQVYVGKGLKGREVRVQYDKDSTMWVINAADGVVVRTIPAIEVSRAKIMSLTMYADAKARRKGKR